MPSFLLRASFAAALLATCAAAVADEVLEVQTYELSPLSAGGEGSRAPSLGLASPAQGEGALAFDEEDETELRLVTSERALIRFLLQELAREGAPKPVKISLAGGRLRVLGPKLTHATLAATLTRVRAQGSRSASVQVRLLVLSPDQASALGMAGAPLSPAQRALLTDAKALGSVDLLARERERVSRALLRRSTFLGDFEVNQTGILPVLNPVIERLLEGVVVETRCRMPPQPGGALRLDCRVEQAARAAATHRALPFGPGGVLDLPALDHLGFSGSLVLKAGQEALLGLAPFGPASAPTSYVGALVSIRSFADNSALPAKSLALRSYDLTGLRARPSFSFRRPSWPSDSASRLHGGAAPLLRDAAPAPLLDHNQVRELVLSRIDPGAWASANGKKGSWIESTPGALTVSHTAEGHAKVAEFLATLRRPEALVRFELLVLETTSAPSAKVLSSGECEALIARAPLRSRVSLSGVPGQRVELIARRELRAMVDIERSSGGTAATAIQVDDPIVETLAAGLALRISTSVLAEEITLEVELDQRGTPNLRSTKTSWGSVELYSATHLHSRRSLTLAAGGGVVLATQAGRSYLLRVAR